MISLAKGWQVGLAAALHNESQLFTKRFAVPMPRGKCKSLYSWDRCFLYPEECLFGAWTVRIACAFSEKGRCVFQKSHMRFWKKGHAILWRCTWEKFSIANVKKQCTEWKKTVHWKKVNSVLNRKIQCIVFIIISVVVYSLAYSYLNDFVKKILGGKPHSLGELKFSPSQPTLMLRVGSVNKSTLWLCKRAFLIKVLFIRSLIRILMTSSRRYSRSQWINQHSDYASELS